MKGGRILVPIFLTLLVGCSEAIPRAGQTLVPASPTPTALVARQVVYVSPGHDESPASAQSDLYVYDPATDKVTRLTNDTDRHYESLPRFHGSRISYIVDGTKLVEIDPATRSRTSVLTAVGNLVTYAWRGDDLAYIDVDHDAGGEGIHRLRIRNTATGQTKTIKTLGTGEGRGTGLDDDVTIHWSGDGAQMLVSATYVDNEPNVRIVRRDGSDAITPIRTATNALWSNDGRSIYVRALNGNTSTRDDRWQRLDIATGDLRTLPLDGDEHHGTLSPDGKLLSVVDFDRTKETHVVKVLDLQAGTVRRVASRSRDPIWLSADSFAATLVADCPSADDPCAYFGFRGAGTRLYRLDGTSKPLALATTFWEGRGALNTDVRFL